MAQEKVYLELPPFTGRNVPIIEIAKAMYKDAQYVRVGLQQGIFRFGYAIKLDDSNEYNYYCPDRMVWEEMPGVIITSGSRETSGPGTGISGASSLWMP